MNQDTARDEILTTGQIAKYCQVDIRTANRWIDKGLLKAHELPITKFRRIYRSHFIEFLHEQKMPIPQEFSDNEKKRILIVDDDTSMAAAMRRILNDSFPDCSVDVAYDGFEAGTMVARNQPHVMILDLKMPGMSGFEVCKRLKSQTRTQSIKIMAVSGTTRNEDWEKISICGADTFLEKPFDDTVFKQKVSELLNSKGALYGSQT